MSSVLPAKISTELVKLEFSREKVVFLLNELGLVIVAFSGWRTSLKNAIALLSNVQSSNITWVLFVPTNMATIAPLPNVAVLS